MLLVEITNSCGNIRESVMELSRGAILHNSSHGLYIKNIKRKNSGGKLLCRENRIPLQRYSCYTDTIYGMRAISNSILGIQP